MRQVARHHQQCHSQDSNTGFHPSQRNSNEPYDIAALEECLRQHEATMHQESNVQDSTEPTDMRVMEYDILEQTDDDASTPQDDVDEEEVWHDCLATRDGDEVLEVADYDLNYDLHYQVTPALVEPENMVK